MNCCSSLNSSPAIHLPPAVHQSPTQKQENAAPDSAVPETTQKINATVNTQDSGETRSEDKGAHDQRNAQNENAANNPLQLNEQEKKQVEALRKRDIEVRAHEAAHLAAAGQHARGGIQLDMTRGPDGRSYAIGGSVGIDTSRESTPEATIRKADQIKRAAMAPAEPSAQDRAVASEATAMKLEAQVELAEQQKAEANQTPSAEDSIQSKDSTKQSTAVAESNKESTNTGCDVCGGGHSTEPHLSSNKSKLMSYSVPEQDGQRLISAIA